MHVTTVFRGSATSSGQGSYALSGKIERRDLAGPSSSAYAVPRMTLTNHPHWMNRRQYLEPNEP
jgi:hypothetical protein